ncbi:hypothetical protein C1N53_04165 [Pontibacter sp. SGAir0037]|nr:hypothetical protein C1N53_04165 [Pontibacter sp. SGAir0037]
MKCIGVLNKASAILLLLIFIWTLAVPVIHTHPDTEESSSSYHEEIEQASVHKQYIKCMFCESMLHKHKEQYTLSHSLAFTVFKAPVIKSVITYKAGVSQLSFLSWTNKGPPQV